MHGGCAPGKMRALAAQEGKFRKRFHPSPANPLADLAPRATAASTAVLRRVGCVFVLHGYEHRDSRRSLPVRAALSRSSALPGTYDDKRLSASSTTGPLQHL
jgi:hypothetical protein